jgi:hypothetical protein
MGLSQIIVKIQNQQNGIEILSWNQLKSIKVGDHGDIVYSSNAGGEYSGASRHLIPIESALRFRFIPPRPGEGISNAG